MVFGFWRNPTYSDPVLGHLVYSCDRWSGRVGDIHFGVMGDKSEPDYRSVQQAKSILSEFGTFLSAAKSYLKTQDLDEWSDPANGELMCNAFGAMAEPGAFTLTCWLSKRPSAVMYVEFRGRRPVEVLFPE